MKNAVIIIVLVAALLGFAFLYKRKKEKKQTTPASQTPTVPQFSPAETAAQVKNLVTRGLITQLPDGGYQFNSSINSNSVIIGPRNTETTEPLITKRDEPLIDNGTHELPLPQNFAPVVDMQVDKSYLDTRLDRDKKSAIVAPTINQASAV